MVLPLEAASSCSSLDCEILVATQPADYPCPVTGSISQSECSWETVPIPSQTKCDPPAENDEPPLTATQPAYESSDWNELGYLIIAFPSSLVDPACKEDNSRTMTVLREAETPPLDAAEHSELWGIHADDKLCEIYDHTKLLYLAQGSSGIVYSTIRIGTDVKVAVKRMRFSDDPGFLERYKDRWHGHTEVTILESLKGFPDISDSRVCQLLDKFENATTLDLIFELIPGGDLLTEVLDRDLGEKTTKHIALQICRTMAKLHKTKQIVHRDLKLQNILVSDDSDTPTVTIVDFGSAKQTSLSKMNTLCGTVGYIAPEVTKGPYGCRIDVFGFGMCLLFMFLSGRRDVIKEILADGLTMDYLDSLLEKKDISLDGQNLLKKTLAVNPDDRISFDDALKEPFFAATPSEPNTTSVTTTAHREGPGKVIQRTGSLTLRQNDGVPKIEALRSTSKRSFEEVDDATLRRSESDRKRSRFEAQDEEQDQLLPGEP